MSYLRLFQVVQDFALGIQSINQARDNNEALLAQFDLRHWASNMETAAIKALGRHDDALVARTVVTLRIDTSTAAVLPVLEVSGPLVQATPVRRAAGVWVFQLRNIGLSFGAVATPASGSTMTLATAICSGSTLYVTTAQVSGGAFALADADFSVAVWGKA